MVHHALERALNSDDGNPALLDTATGALSPQAFVMRLEEAAALTGRLGCGLSVVMIELRGAEALCYAHGAEIVDRLLAEMVDRLWALARKSDSVARTGSTRLCVLLPGTDREGADTYAERLRPYLGKAYRYKGNPLQATIDVSAAGTLPGETPDSADLLRQIGR
jgi:diguanylate cyclase (GGDEF)-like protein